MRWSVRLRKIATVLALGVGAGAATGLPASPAHAEGPYYFTCRGPLAPGGTVAVNISVSSREPAVGQPLVVQWQLGVQSPLKVNDPFDDRKLDKGGHLAVTGRVYATGVWTGRGTIDATGTEFYDAERLRQPTRSDGVVAEFTVDGVEQVSKKTFPTERVYGNTTEAALRLITCGGVYDRKRHGYSDNIIVYATLSNTRAA